MTFRALSTDDVIALAVEARLNAIEWGGDVHVPLGELDVARAVGEATRAAGLEVASFGSYVVAGTLRDGDVDALVATANALGAPHARVWSRGGAQELAAIASAGLPVSTEFHPGTDTETATSTVELLRAVEGVRTYWQPHPRLTDEANLAELRLLGGLVSNLHVFSWQKDGTRLALADKAGLWRAALDAVPAGDRVALLEFVKDDDQQQFLEDASTLRSWLDE